MNIWKAIYRGLVAIRRALNVLIDYTRAKAYPASGGRRNRKIEATENQPALP